jgi:hypothetical protein
MRECRPASWRTNQVARNRQRRSFDLWIEFFFGPQLTLPLAVLTDWLVAAWLLTALASVLRPIKSA